MNDEATYDVLVIGSGPAGQKAAIQAAKLGKRVAVIEQGAAAGGACVHRGTIPSKTLRETSLVLGTFRRRSGDIVPLSVPENLKIASLMTRLDNVVRAHETYIIDQLNRNGVELIHGRGRFLSPTEIEVQAVNGNRMVVRGSVIVIAAGSKPRTPPNIPVDHESILDSDSILSLLYLPRSMTVLGAGVVASEYASIFATLGVNVTMIDRAPRPMAFVEPEFTQRFVDNFERCNGRFIGQATIGRVATDGASVTVELGTGEVIRSDKLLCALGRVAAVERLNLESTGLAPNERGFLTVDEYCRTSVQHIYAVGDVIGPPALAASAMEQGRRAVCHAFGTNPGASPDLIPVGIYTIPEMASVGLTEQQAIERNGTVLVGRARFEEIARGHIINNTDGMLKLVADGHGRRLLGVQIIGENATELIHVGQMALTTGAPVDAFIENVFNFPTLTEAYRVAALDIAGRRARLREARRPATAPASPPPAP